jgi:UDP-N-acetylglucosamine 2-epimerase
MRISYVIGTRPNVVKMASVIAALRTRMPAAEHVIVHTGQHYDRLMSDVFIDELEVPPPDHTLDVGSGSHAVQTARVMERLEPVLSHEPPDLLIVPGDVNSTMAAALVAVKLGVPLAHVESGLRSFDRTMPEEINRIVTDQFSDLLFLHSEDAIGERRGSSAWSAAATCWSRCTGPTSSTARCSQTWSRTSSASRPSCRSCSRSTRARGEGWRRSASIPRSS